MNRDRNRVCPVALADSLDSRIRRWLQNPRKILAPFVREGMTVLDVGCGPGLFSIEMAQMVGANGRVIAADLQKGMLQKLSAKVEGTPLADRITLIECEKSRLNVADRVDFILAFFVVHEVPDKNSLFRELKSVLGDNGEMLLVEPKLFHVSRREFGLTTAVAEKNGLKAFEGPRVRFSWSAVLRHI
jgi:ubiquinone/menaquinone biosynthesis C-methylase UbiE